MSVESGSGTPLFTIITSIILIIVAAYLIFKLFQVVKKLFGK